MTVQGTDEQDGRRRHEPELRPDQQAPAVAPVDLRAEAHRHEHHRPELHRADEADRGRRVGQVIDLHEQGDDRELTPDLGDELPRPEQPEIARGA